MEEVGKPILLLDNVNPHHYVATIENAMLLSGKNSIVFYIDEDFEIFLKKLNPKTLPKFISLLNAPNINLLPLHKTGLINDGDIFPDKYDPHIWLSPSNIYYMLIKIYDVLLEYNPTNKEKYTNNLKKAITQLQTTADNVAQKLSRYFEKKYAVTHDAFQYFESSFQCIGIKECNKQYNFRFKTYATTENAKSHVIQNIHLKATEQPPRLSCIISDSKINSHLLLNLKTVSISPLGNDLTLDSNIHLNILNNIAHKLTECFDNTENL